jgi:hypothetical protein
MRRRALSVIEDSNIQMFQFVIAEFSDDVLEERNAWVVDR